MGKYELAHLYLENGTQPTLQERNGQLPPLGRKEKANRDNNLAKFTNLAQSLLTEPNARLQLLQHILNTNQTLDGNLEKELRVNELHIITIVPTKN